MPRETSTYLRFSLGCIILVLANACETPPARDSSVAPASYEALIATSRTPANWLTYSGSYDGQRFSALADINRSNAGRLEHRWTLRMETTEPVETSPLVVNEVMYLTRPPNDVSAVDAFTGETIWNFHWPLPGDLHLCCGKVNRGLAILDETLYMGTLDGHLVALDAKSGSERWNVQVVDRDRGSITAAPLAVKDMILTGIAIRAGASVLDEVGTAAQRGMIDAYDADTGALRWRFYTVPAPGEPGFETWLDESSLVGGGSTWMTGSFDPDLNLVYWSTGAPGMWAASDFHKGDNLYTCSILALDADTGALQWHFQTTPHDTHDWDAVHVLVLADLDFRGRRRELLLHANRNGFFYVLDRTTGEFLLAREFARQNWALGIDERGRPLTRPESRRTPDGTLTSPSEGGAASWWSPSFSPTTKLFYLTAHDSSDVFFVRKFAEAGINSLDDLRRVLREAGSKEVIELKEKDEFRDRVAFGESSSSVRALDPTSGEIRWEFPLPERSTSGILTTAGDLLFVGSTLGDFWALDAYSGDVIWHGNLEGWIHSAPIAYMSRGTQFIGIASSTGLHTFALAE